MKEIKVKLYKFDELSEEAQEKAIEAERNNMDIWFYVDNEIESIYTIGDIIGCGKQYIKYELSLCSYSYIEYKEYDSPEEEICGIRALKYIYNHFIAPNMTYNIIFNKDYTKKHYNKCKKHFHINGYYMEDIILKTYNDIINEIRKSKNIKHITVHYFIQTLEENITSAIMNQVEYVMSDDFIREELLNIEEEIYNSDGTIYKG